MKDIEDNGQSWLVYGRMTRKDKYARLFVVQADDREGAKEIAQASTRHRILMIRKIRRMKCYHKGCGHEWTYKGERTKYATCPNCLKQVRII